MANLWVSETYVNADKGYTYGDQPPYESFTDDPGELYRRMRREYGRCTGSVRVDTADGKSIKIGWVFHRRVPYEGPHRAGQPTTYLQETWITLYDKQDTVVRTKHYHSLGA